MAEDRPSCITIAPCRASEIHSIFTESEFKRLASSGGIIATSTWGQGLYRKIDNWLLNLIPRYAFIKSFTESLGGQSQSTLKPVLVRFDDLAQMSFEVERGPGDLVTVYLPGSPDPWSGTVAQDTADRVEPLAGDFAAVVKSLRQIGRGASVLLEAPPVD